jgi:hypothetical protein
MNPGGGVVTIAAACLVAGCLDLSPLPYAAPYAGADASAGGLADAGDRDAQVGECRQCLSAGPCASPYTACQADPKCGTFADCMTASLCWGSSLTDLAHLSPCVLNCAASAGIYSQNDPSAAAVSNVFTCVQDPTKCASVCIGGSGH